MSFFVETVDSVLKHIESIDGLSNEGRAAIVDGYIEELGNDAQKFLALYPLSHESLHFRYDYAYPEGKTLYEFEFVVDGSNIEVGVVRVVYVEHTSRALP